MDKMWSAALCTLGVAKPILGCTCLNGRPVSTAPAAITTGMVRKVTRVTIYVQISFKDHIF